MNDDDPWKGLKNEKNKLSSVDFDLTHRLAGTELFTIRHNVFNGEGKIRRKCECWLNFWHKKWWSFIVQNLKHPSHGRPLCTIRVCTTQSQEQKLPHFLFLKFPIQPLISTFNHPPLMVQPPNPLNQVHHLRPFSLNWPPPTPHFKHHHPIAENIRLFSGFSVLKILWCKVPHCSGGQSGDWTLVMIHQLCQPKIPQPGVHVSIQQYVPCLDVPVNHSLLTFLVKVNQNRGQPKSNVHPVGPTQQPPPFRFLVKHLV